MMSDSPTALPMGFSTKSMGYGLSESYGFSLLTNLVNRKMYGLLESMARGYRRYGLLEI